MTEMSVKTEFSESQELLSREDLAWLAGRGITASRIREQVEIFKRGVVPADLARPASPGDGIVVLAPEDVERLAREFAQRRRGLRIVKFVPASGAATRMFRAALLYLKHGAVTEALVQKDAGHPDREKREDARRMLELMDGLRRRRFAFSDELERVLAGQGFDMDALMAAGDFTAPLEFLLTEKGLNYANRPKALLLFHSYPEGPRTPLEEHLAEAREYACDEQGEGHIHFTVSPEHREAIEKRLSEQVPRFEVHRGRVFRFVTGYSEQKSQTDTAAVDLSNRLFRDGQNRLVLRAGGHGALLENLGDLDADIVYIKNIDNIAPDWLKPVSNLYKRALGSYLLELREEVRRMLGQLEQGEVSPARIDEMVRYGREALNIPFPSGFDVFSHEGKREYLIDRLDRPMRVCGMVRNQGEPGGGPFWTKESDGGVSLQIVEGFQIDKHSPAQVAIAAQATHFNPVDLVCAIRDWRGRPFDLKRFVDPGACFISEKSHEGRPLKALESPGLWNGSMSGWISVFVETPIDTFTPCKTINDLLRREHLPPEQQEENRL